MRLHPDIGVGKFSSYFRYFRFILSYKIRLPCSSRIGIKSLAQEVRQKSHISERRILCNIPSCWVTVRLSGVLYTKNEYNLFNQKLDAVEMLNIFLFNNFFEKKNNNIFWENVKNCFGDAQGRMVNTVSWGENPGRRRCSVPLFGIFERNLC